MTNFGILSGWFTQSDEPHSKKEYNYIFNMNNSGYVEWVERETRGMNIKYQTSLVYVEKPFCNPIEVTERRNLVYNFRCVPSYSSFFVINKKYISESPYNFVVTNHFCFVLNRSLLARDQKGHLVAGIYFPVIDKDSQFTLFFEENSGKQRIKIKFSLFANIDMVSNCLLSIILIIFDLHHPNGVTEYFKYNKID